MKSKPENQNLLVTSETTEGRELANTNNGILAVIERVVLDPNADMDKLEKMLDMQERVMARDAKIAYNSSMAMLQSQLPEISKEGEIAVNGNVRSKYARYEDIMKAIKPLLSTHGISISFRANFSENMLDITGVISHQEGHSEETTMRLPFDSSGSKNTVQAIGSSVSYGKRYVLCMLLNISTGGEDDDGNTSAKPGAGISDDTVSKIQQGMEVTGKSLEDCLAFINGIFAAEYTRLTEMTEPEGLRLLKKLNMLADGEQQ